jgi:hypothetical protein
MAEPAIDPTEPPAAGGATESAGSGGTAGWRDAIADARLRQFAERFTGPAEMARAAFELRQKLSNAVALPGRGAGPEEVLEFRRKLGVPETPGGYEFAAADGGAGEADRAFREAAAKAFHEAGVTADQARALSAWWDAYAADARLRSQRDADGAKAKAEADLRRDWGRDFEVNMELAARAARAFGEEGLTALLDERLADGTRVGDRPALLKAFAAAGRHLLEDEFQAGAAGTPPKTARERIDELTRLMFDDPKAYRSDAVQGELKSLYDRLTGGAPVVGAEGRRL